MWRQRHTVVLLMFRPSGILLFALLLVSLAGWRVGVPTLAASQQAQEETEDTEPEAPYEFVSGTIVALSAGQIVVNRAVPGKPPENRTFLINAQTKVEGRLRVKTRVTVGFKATEDAEPVAVRVIVRAAIPRK